VGQTETGHHPHGLDELRPVGLQQIAVRPGLGQPRRAGAIGQGDEFHQDLDVVQLHRVGHRKSGGPQVGEEAELGPRPFPRLHGAAVARALGHGPAVTGVAGGSTVGVAGVAMEQPILQAAVALRRHHHRPILGGPVEQVHVGFLAGLEDAELGVDCRAFGDQPVGPGFGPGEDADVVPG
jgi:hypothetical protein